MKYEFIRVTDDYKNDETNFYLDELDHKVTLKFESLVDRHPGLKWPIALFINGVLITPEERVRKSIDGKDVFRTNFKIDTDNKTIKFEDVKTMRLKDSVYLVFTSNSKNGRFIGQMSLGNFEVLNEREIEVAGDYPVPVNENLLGIFVNGILYDSNSISVRNSDRNTQIITFDGYCPDKKDSVAFLYYKESK